MHKAKNREMCLWASGNDTTEALLLVDSVLEESIPEVRGSESREPLVDVSPLPT